MTAHTICNLTVSHVRSDRRKPRRPVLYCTRLSRVHRMFHASPFPCLIMKSEGQNLITESTHSHLHSRTRWHRVGLISVKSRHSSSPDRTGQGSNRRFKAHFLPLSHSREQEEADLRGFSGRAAGGAYVCCPPRI